MQETFGHNAPTHTYALSTHTLNWTFMYLRWRLLERSVCDSLDGRDIKHPNQEHKTHQQ